MASLASQTAEYDEVFAEAEVRPHYLGGLQLGVGVPISREHLSPLRRLQEQQQQR